MHQRTKFLFGIGFVLTSALGSAFGFAPGHLYSTNYFEADIREYSANGAALGSLDLFAHAFDLRGIEFSGDRLYAVSSLETSLEVLTIDSGGNVDGTYPMASATAFGNVTLGKIAFGAGNDFFVGTFQGVAKFSKGSFGSGHFIWTSEPVFDIAVLPSGNLLVAQNYSLVEISETGTLIREITTPGVFFTDIRGMTYDPATDSIFVSMLGDSMTPHRLMRLDFQSGALETETSFIYGNDMFVADGGRLLVGSWTQDPAIFNLDLAQTGGFAGGQRLFVTERAVPEPATMWAIAVGLAGLRFRMRSVRGSINR